MLKPKPLYPGPRPPYLEALVKLVSDRLAQHLEDDNDPHGTRELIPVTYSGQVNPADMTPYKEGDLFVNTTEGILYRCGVSGISLVWIPVALKGSSEGVTPFPSGTYVRLDDDNDVYAAVSMILGKLGATVI